ncbi:hypothetical protein CLV31_11915 [Algoriphagus aquaeductus]|uniref:Uncharacterized protein n=1 Tax=Algoriphagus aquaeductus TaxID=475299 RepID=A0A326RL11_9BACT|nr:hypothetical protein CLV31_11915 [Algoriphagus aquaeductus]
MTEGFLISAFFEKFHKLAKPTSMKADKQKNKKGESTPLIFYKYNLLSWFIS